MASFLQVDGAIEYLDSWKKRFHSKHVHLVDFGKARRRINTASGKYRSYNQHLPAKVLDRGSFVFIGNGSVVMELMEDYVPGIGKKVSEGFGWIDGLDLTDSELSWNDILLMRPVPLPVAEKYGISGNRRICGWRPPYWLKTNVCECMVPE